MKNILATDKAPAAIGPYSQGVSAPLRSLAVRAEMLCFEPDEQLDCFTDYRRLDAERRLDGAIDRLRERYGLGAVLRGAVFADPSMALPPAQEEYSFVRRLKEA